MIDVLLVDDEDMIRQGILHSVDWNNFNMRVIGEAEDGEEALEIFSKHKPQVILTDIKMPFMDGLELLEKVKAENDNTYIIIISGYDEFQYAQKAVKLGAFDFILKPIELDYLEQILTKINADFAVKMEKEKDVQVLKEKVENIRSILQEGFFKDLIFKKFDRDAVEEKIKELEIIEFGYNTALLVQLDESEITNETFLNKEQFEREKEIFIIEMNQREYTFLILGTHEADVKSKRSTICNRIRDEVNASITIGLGNIYPSILQLSQSYEEALEALEYKFILGNGQDIDYNSIKDRVTAYSNVINNKDYDLIYSLDFTDKPRLQKDINQLMSELKNTGRDSYLYSQLIISNIYMSAIKALKEIGGNVEEVFHHPLEEFKQLASNPTIERVEDKLLVMLFKIADYINERKFGKYAYIIEKAKLYIHQHHQNPDLSIEAVARYVNISNSYFSILFKQETGQTFVDYLTSFRIEKAKYLLKVSGYLSYEISDQVGFNNSTYFSTIFKKYNGCSPTEYRKRILEEENGS
ncbi:response regulator [Neobacillus sp. 3P2-tot-E-2]|uniref:response regulator n=1 Tax=Neobacillus sp. 3P2-tot-E-2 TaxID=3132212 RepID=UPI0039A3A162